MRVGENVTSRLVGDKMGGISLVTVGVDEGGGVAVGFFQISVGPGRDLLDRNWSIG